MGTFTLKHGTGIDLWWCERAEDRPYLSEARYVTAGKWNGFEWWLNPDQKSIHEERHFKDDLEHGIERSWNRQGRLRRGYPRYWINNVRMTKREYLRACVSDPTLPPFREKDNRPQRTFPPEVSACRSGRRRPSAG
jgi:hypothetical protein